MWSDPSPHKSGFVTANGIRLNYLDWGGSGPTLVLIHGALANLHAFDDLASAFTGRFHVVAYARRGHGQSDAKGPYDTATLTEDLRGFMDALGIAKAHLTGWSMGGNEVTEMASTYPDRVDGIVYLEGAYNMADYMLADAMKAQPDTTTPASALTSLDEYRAYQRDTLFSEVRDASRVEAFIRDSVVIQPDGTVRERMSQSVAQELFATMLRDRRDYTKVRSPALAIYAETFLDVTHGDPAQRARNLAWEQKYWVPFRTASIKRIQRELPGVEILTVPGTHMDFFFTSRERVVNAMLPFLNRSAPRR